jgi:antitoxin Phd
MNKHTRVWSLQDAKARFSEVVRRAQEEGPQTVTIRGHPAAVVTAARKGSTEVETGTGKDLVRALQTCPFPDIFDDFDELRVREPMVTRDVDFD